MPHHGTGPRTQPTDQRTACSDDADRTKKLDCQPSSVNDHHSSRLGSNFETGKFRQPCQGTVTVHGTGGLFLFDFLCSFFWGEECPVQLIRHRTPGGSSRPGQIVATGSFRPNGPKFGHKLSCPTLSNATRPKTRPHARPLCPAPRTCRRSSPRRTRRLPHPAVSARRRDTIRSQGRTAPIPGPTRSPVPSLNRAAIPPTTRPINPRHRPRPRPAQRSGAHRA